MSIYRLKGTSGAVLNQNFPLGSGLRIGGSDDGSIPIEGSAVLAEVEVQDKAVIIRALDESASLSVNGESVTEASLAGGDEIRVAGCRFILQAPGLKPERVLVGDAVRAPGPRWPWWLAAAALAAAGGLAWQQGWLQALLQSMGVAP